MSRPTLTLPVIFRPGKDGEEDYVVYRTFTDTQEDLETVCSFFRPIVKAAIENGEMETTPQADPKS